MLRLARVGGLSMSPTLEDGDFVLALGRHLAGPPRRGDVVLVQHAALGLIVKRVAALDRSSGELELTGDNTLSCSRESLGRVPRRDVVGRVLLRVGRGRAGISRLRRDPC